MKKNKSNIKQFKLRLILIVPALLLMFFFGFLIYLYEFEAKILPQISVGQTKIGGYTFEKAQVSLSSIEENLPEEMIVVAQNKDYLISLKNAELNLDTDQSLTNAWSVGRENKLAWQKQLSRLVTKKNIPWQISYNQDNLNDQIKEISKKIENQSKSPKVEIKNKRFVVTDGISGEFLHPQESIDLIEKNWQQGNFSKMDLPTTKIEYSQINQKLNTFMEELNGLNQEYNLIAEEKIKKINLEDINNWIFFYIKSANDIAWDLSKANIASDLEIISQEIELKPQNAKLVFSGGKIVISKSAVDGKRFNAKEAVNIVIDGIKTKKNEIKLSIVNIPAEITAENYLNLGIKELIGTATTNYRGSTVNRRHNIANGASIVSGTVVKPGEEFSTAQVMGDVSDVTGFLPELVIKGNRTVPEFGGGLCQVSTTLFRSVLNAGLKVTERRNHSYRVAYYEPPLGLDATVYFPHPDFRFVNDTSNYILIQSKVSGNSITFELYGAKDGRTATITNPEIISTSPAGEPKFIETEDLFKGETKQIEKPHEGATTIAYYTVIKDGKELFKQTFKSVYKPWPAQYLVGTKEPPTPASETIPEASIAPESEAIPTI